MNEPDRRTVADALTAVRERTLELISGLSDDALSRQHSLLMSPIIWDIGHIGAFEELWLVRRLGTVSSEAELDAVYDAFRTPRSERSGLRLPAGQSLLSRLEDVRKQALSLLETVEFDPANQLLRNGFAYEMVLEHEAQHQETILQTICLMTSEPYESVTRWSCPAGNGAMAGEMVRVPAGPFYMGAGPDGFAYDNERPRHAAHVGEFEIGRYPVTNGEYVDFIAAGGYQDRGLWTADGWVWKERASLLAPMYWELVDGSEPASAAEAACAARDLGIRGWQRRTSLGVERVDPFVPVVHISCHEAEAYARFMSGRLPTEAEWEKAAAWDPASESPRTFPWGEDSDPDGKANLDQLAFGPAAIGAFPAGRSVVGCEQMLGDVWEWTASTLSAYPGFRAFPYREYSEVFFGTEYRVLRGSSWATRPSVSRNSFRNWDYPIRRQIFSGVRLARDA
ncbi:MAG: ergothioneine biosynthesis protein EgtB [Gemmatimonadales bacterium]|nr:MAG: ergothioneine biosynthesis protein EgtB [Gemmatimonadales bacterium]